MKKDSTIQAIRKVRHEISSEFGHDPKKLVFHYIEQQKRHSAKLIEKLPQDTLNQHTDIYVEESKYPPLPS